MSEQELICEAELQKHLLPEKFGDTLDFYTVEAILQNTKGIEIPVDLSKRYMSTINLYLSAIDTIYFIL